MQYGDPVGLLSSLVKEIKLKLDIEPHIRRSRDSVVDIATRYGLDGQGVRVRVQVGQ
jgi:hypothetical protein